MSRHGPARSRLSQSLRNANELSQVIAGGLGWWKSVAWTETITVLRPFMGIGSEDLTLRPCTGIAETFWRGSMEDN